VFVKLRYNNLPIRSESVDFLHFEVQIGYWTEETITRFFRVLMEDHKFDNQAIKLLLSKLISEVIESIMSQWIDNKLFNLFHFISIDTIDVWNFINIERYDVEGEECNNGHNLDGFIMDYDFSKFGFLRRIRVVNTDSSFSEWLYL